MILEFSTEINGKPTYFIEKIWSGLLQMDDELYSDYLHPDGLPPQSKSASHYRKFTPKIHTVRSEKYDFIETKTLIHFFVNCDKPNVFQFAPSVFVKNVQNIFMTYSHNDIIQISIDERELFSYSERFDFAVNSGFDNWDDFFNYYLPKIKASKNKSFSGKIIHWTDKIY